MTHEDIDRSFKKVIHAFKNGAKDPPDALFALVANVLHNLQTIADALQAIARAKEK